MTKAQAATSRGIKAILVATVFVGITAASCGTTSEDPATTDSAPETSAPATSSPPDVDEDTVTATETPEDQAAEQSRPLIEQYVELVDQTSQSPQEADLEGLENIMISSALNDHTNRLAAMQAQGVSQQGNTQIVTVSDPKVDLPNETVEYLVCTDVSEIKIVDGEDQDVTNPDRADRALIRMGVTNFEYPDPSQWKIGFTEWQEDETC